MSMDWFRSWHGAPTDPKWLLIAKRSETQPGVVSAIVWALLDHASQNSEQRGNVDKFDPETYAAFSGFEESTIRRVLKSLKEKNLIIDGYLAAWDKRQPKREDHSTDRVQKHRNAKKRNETQETPREEEIRLDQISNGGGGEKRAKLVSDEAQETADAMATACGYPDPKVCPLGWYGAALWVQKCLNEGWPPELMVAGTLDTAKRKRDGPIENYKYLEKPLARFIAENSRPLPKIEVREAETVVIHDGRTGIQKTESLSNVARRHAEAGIGFGERPATPGLRLVEGGSDVRLLPKSGGE